MSIYAIKSSKASDLDFKVFEFSTNKCWVPDYFTPCFPDSIWRVNNHLECDRKTSFDRCRTTHQSACQMDFWSSTYDHRRSLDRSISRSFARYLAWSLTWSLARSLAPSIAGSIARSLDRSLARSLDRSLDRLIARSSRWIWNKSNKHFLPRWPMYCMFASYVLLGRCHIYRERDIYTYTYGLQTVLCLKLHTSCRVF